MNGTPRTVSWSVASSLAFAGCPPTRWMKRGRSWLPKTYVGENGSGNARSNSSTSAPHGAPREAHAAASRRGTRGAGRRRPRRSTAGASRRRRTPRPRGSAADRGTRRPRRGARARTRWCRGDRWCGRAAGRSRAGCPREGTARQENGLSANDSSLKIALKMSSRSPSTPSREPVAHDVEHRRLHLRVAVVEVGLEAEEARPVPLAGGRVVVPAAAAEHRAPVVRRGLARRACARRARCRSRAAGSSRELRDSRNHGCWSEVWLSTMSRTIFIPRACDLADELAAVVERAVLGRDGEVVADVVAEVGLRALEERREPERLDAERLAGSRACR